MTKQKSPSEIYLSDYLQLKILQEAIYFAFATWANHVQNLIPKFKILNVFWTCSVSKGKTEQFNFFD